MNREHRKENKKLYEKALRKKGRDKTTVWKDIANLGWEELNEPFKWGYQKYFVLRKDVAERKDAKEIQKLLDMVNYGIICRDKKFLYKNWKTKKMKPMEHQLGYISHKDYNKLTPTQTDNFKEYHKKDWRGQYRLVGFKLTLPDYYFVEKIQAFYVTKVLKTDPILQSKYDRLEQEIDHEMLWPKLDNLLGIKHNDGWFIKQKFAKEIMVAKEFKALKLKLKKDY